MIGPRGARTALAGVAAALTLGSLLVSLPDAAGREFWSDGATYYSMALSLARDGDLRFEPRDLERVRREYPGGPQGLFLKRTAGGLRFGCGEPGRGCLGFHDRVALYYAKPAAYPLVATPLVALLGSPGLLATNALLFGAALALGYSALRRRAAAGPALAVAFSMLGATVAPVYVLWQQPEVFNLFVVSLALWAWSTGRPMASAIAFGVAAYAKPTHVLAALPLGLEPFVAGLREPRTALLESARRGAALAAAAGLAFGLYGLATGELNYQGGERKTFYGRYPGESPEVTFDNAGTWMTTEQVGPRVEGDEARRRPGEQAAERNPEELRRAFAWNLVYFWIGRYAGALAYFFPVGLAALLYLFAGPRDVGGGLCLGALVLSWIAYIVMIPDNWYGGGGALGNRYFLGLLPLGLFIAPRGRELLVAALGGIGGLLCVAPILIAPLEASLRPEQAAQRWPFRLLPAERTMLNDLSFNVRPWRRKQAFGPARPDSALPPPSPQPAFFLYFPDDGTSGRETAFGEEGVRLKAGRSAELLIRADRPVRRIRLHVHAGESGERLRVSSGAEVARTLLEPKRAGRLELRPGSGVEYYGSWVYVLRLSSEAPESARPGSFVSLGLEIEPPEP